MNHVYLSIYRQEGDEMCLLEAVRIQAEDDVASAEWVLNHLNTNYSRTRSLMGRVYWQKDGRYVYFVTSTDILAVRDREDMNLLCHEGEV